MQYNRLIKRAAQDFINGRGDNKANISKILYYGAIQNAIFYSLQQALFAVTFGDDEEEDEKNEQKYARVANGMIDTILRGSGIYGAIFATTKNTVLEFFEQEITQLIDLRAKSKSEHNWKEADKIRTQLEKKGITLEDHKDGKTTWKKL